MALAKPIAAKVTRDKSNSFSTRWRTIHEKSLSLIEAIIHELIFSASIWSYSKVFEIPDRTNSKSKVKIKLEKNLFVGFFGVLKMP